MTRALVLTAGRATRLRPLSLVRAKAAMPVAGEPLVTRILRWLASQGVRDAVLNLHHLPETITARVGDGADAGVRVRYSWEPVLLGSAGGPRQALPLLSEPDTRTVEPGTGRERGAPSAEPPYFLIVNGDTLAAVDLPAMVEAHRRSGALVTLAVGPTVDPEKYGGVVAARDGAVTGFLTRGAATPSLHFVGVQVADAGAFDTVPPSAPYESVGALYPALVRARPGSVRVFHVDGEFVDIGTPADYLAASLQLVSREGDPPVPGARVRLGAGAVVERSILWDEVTVGEGATLRDCIVTDGVRVPAGTSWSRQTLRRGDGGLAPGERLVGNLAVAAF
jgi:NDP-sugar pyrophosphorylase family protein